MHFNQPMLEADTAVVGGGLVGMAIAYGLQRQGARVTVYDEGDDALRAARGNFGLVWIQQSAQLSMRVGVARRRSGRSLRRSCSSTPGGTSNCISRVASTTACRRRTRRRRSRAARSTRRARW